MRGQYKGPEINDAIEIERQKLINEAKKEPICMLVDSPDPHGQFICLHFSAVCLHFIAGFFTFSFLSFELGVGGSTDTANTGRKFFGEKRDQFLNLVKVHSNFETI